MSGSSAAKRFDGLVNRDAERGGEWLVLLRCPACGVQFDDDEYPPAHIRTHSPEDFGLSPMRQSPDVPGPRARDRGGAD
jgi:hypothetical protein